MSFQNQSHLLIVEDDRGRHEFPLDAPCYSIGRDPRSDIRLASQFVSRCHATLIRLTNNYGSCYYRIVDGNARGKPSANGLLINGKKVDGLDLWSGDEIVLSPNVRATYYLLEKGIVETISPDEFDDPDDIGGVFARLSPRRPSPLDAEDNPDEDILIP